MKNRLFYIFSIGLAFYGGMKISQKKEIKIIEKIVEKTIVSPNASKTILSQRYKLQEKKDELKECVVQYDKLVGNTNHAIENLKAQIHICEGRYYSDSDPYPEENLEPETVKDKEPEIVWPPLVDY